ncbi:hypothetical protein DSL72_008153 [Monilinia vaccinii-corymbosi]|uniref:Uncharacterized protein n=1 Tax=Monilinia vaccinii-corymbosi TaxID=61207 RepID=A0A8A3PJX8_9HELO|nr:hypothetical protein DSL72_008153 [Monilinia vaccinii-corymbosi]
MMILQGHRSNSTSSEGSFKPSEPQQSSRFSRREPKPWARQSSLPSYQFDRGANPTPFNTMHMPRLDSYDSQERRQHVPIWEPLYMVDTLDQKEQGGKSKSGMLMNTNGLRQQSKRPFSDGADREDSSTDNGCCSWKLCLSVLTANWMSRAM